MRISALHTYVIKGCFRTDQRRIDVEPWGLAGDRRFMIVDENDVMLTQREEPGLVRITPTLGADGDDRLILRAHDHPDLAVLPVATELVDTAVYHQAIQASRLDAAADDWLTEVLGRKAHLLWLEDPTRRSVSRVDPTDPRRVNLADEYPVSLANTASLDAVNDWMAEAQSVEWPVPMARFRPNIVIDGAAAWAEDGWFGRRLHVGEAVFLVDSHCARCVVTTTDQTTGNRGREPLRTLARYRNINRRLAFAVNLVPEQLGTIAVGDEITIS